MFFINGYVGEMVMLVPRYNHLEGLSKRDKHQTRAVHTRYSAPQECMYAHTLFWDTLYSKIVRKTFLMTLVQHVKKKKTHKNPHQKTNK